MSDKKIVVPEGMLKAATVAYNAKTGSMGYKYVIDRNVTEATLEAALRWLSENPQHPTDYEFGEVVNACRDSVGIDAWEKDTEWMRAGMLCHEWQTRMFLAPDPEGTAEIDPEKERFRAALEELARLGNGEHYGNSDGNVIAQKALGVDKTDPATGVTGEFGKAWHACTVEINRVGGVTKAAEFLRRYNPEVYSRVDGVPEEIKDLWWASPTPDTKRRIIEAYSRGKESK